MKTVRNLLVATAFMVTLSTMATDGKVITGEKHTVTITENKEIVDVSILNTDNQDYTLYIINPNGELVFSGKLGNDSSLVKRFDFKGAIEGNYTFKFKTNVGDNFTYNLKTGSLR